MIQLIGFAWFANAGMLLWAVAAAVPVLIHLWSRRTYQETSWAAMRFLLTAVRKNQRRLRIEQLILLAMRALILILLSIALAEPILIGLPIGISTPRQPPTYTILVIDSSYSMGYQHLGEARFATAQKLASNTVRQANPGDAFSLVRMTSRAEAVVGEASANQAAVLDEIAGLELSDSNADLSPTLIAIDDLIEAASSRFDRRQVKILSDFDSNTWDALNSTNLRAEFDRWATKSSLTLVDVGQAEVTNVAITRIETADRAITSTEAIDMEVELANSGHRDLTRRRVELLVNGQQVGEQYIDIPATGRGIATFTHQFPAASNYTVQARIGEDRLHVDNNRWMSVSVRSALRVLCIQGRPHAAEYVALALRPNTDAMSVIHPDVRSSHDLFDVTLADFDCVFLCNVASISQEEARLLHDYVTQGGGLVFVLGDLVDAEKYNEALGEESESHLLPTGVEAVIGDRLYHFDPREYRHGLIAPFRGHERTGLLTTPIWKYFRLARPTHDANVALAFDNGDPAIVEATFGKGRTIMVATAASPESVDHNSDPPTPWTALASWPSFPPLIHEMVHFVTGGNDGHRNLTVGESITSHLPRGVTDASLATPDATETTISAQGDQRLWTFDQTTRHGIYLARYDERRTELFAVNVNPRESELSRADTASLEHYFQEPQLHDMTGTSKNLSDTPLYRLVLGLLVALLLGETFLAWTFRRESR